MEFDGPIPGQSLTGELGSKPWERPPEIVDPEEAIAYHIDRLREPKVMNSVLDSISQHELPVSFVTELMLTGGVYKGIHTIDISLIIAPVIHEYLVELLESEDVAFEEFFPENDESDVLQAMAIKGAKEGLSKPKKVEEVEEPMEEEMMEEEAPKRGLMSRGDVS